MNKRAKSFSKTSMLSVMTQSNREQDSLYVPPLDFITVRILYLRMSDTAPEIFAVKVTFFDQLLINIGVQAIGRREKYKQDSVAATGSMAFDPSDYEKMCLFADNPLTVRIQPVEKSDITMKLASLETSLDTSLEKTSNHHFEDVSCCNIDILPLFKGTKKMLVNKRMQPLIKPSTLHQKSWGNLPLICLEIEMIRSNENENHQKILEDSNFMTMTLIGAYNMPVSFEDDCIYMAASMLPLNNDMNSMMFTFNNGYRQPKRFENTSFYPEWESQRLGEEYFSKNQKKITFNKNDILNESDLDLEYYFKKRPVSNNVVWASFHRILMMKSEEWLRHNLKRFFWPFEVHIYGENMGYSFMAFLNLSIFLYPGEKKIITAVPLMWANQQEMMEKCGCEFLLTPNANSSNMMPKKKQTGTESLSTQDKSSSVATSSFPTGADDNYAFILLQITLDKPLFEIAIPPFIHNLDIHEMLSEIQGRSVGPRRECTGRGQLDNDWQQTVKNAMSSLRKVPYHGMTEFCAFNRQLSGTRTRLEINTSFWLDAAVYVNNNFNIKEYLQSDETFEEMLMMSHACLLQLTCDTLIGVENRSLTNPVIRAARHARQMQDIPHALDLYLQRVTEHRRCGDSWRELAVCLLDVDRDWALVCINKSISLNPRHHLSLLIKASLVFDDNPDDAEPFFFALLAYYPYWTTIWVIASAYFIERELFDLADKTMEIVKKNFADGTNVDPAKTRSWEQELGDWWDPTPLLPGHNRYYYAADLLLRLRAIGLAEACLSRALVETGDTAAYYHLVALCCRLQGKLEDAMCHISSALSKHGEIGYLRTFEAECNHKLKKNKEAMKSFEKAVNCSGAYCTLLSISCWESQRGRAILADLVRRLPSAYSWMALADDWMARASMGEGGDGGCTDEQKAARNCAVACAVQALKWDRKAGRAWALLSKQVSPSARRLYCRDMAVACGYEFQSDQKIEFASASKQTLCHRLAVTLRECKCSLCGSIQLSSG